MGESRVVGSAFLHIYLSIYLIYICVCRFNNAVNDIEHLTMRRLYVLTLCDCYLSVRIHPNTSALTLIRFLIIVDPTFIIRKSSKRPLNVLCSLNLPSFSSTVDLIFPLRQTLLRKLCLGLDLIWCDRSMGRTLKVNAALILPWKEYFHQQQDVFSCIVN